MLTKPFFFGASKDQLFGIQTVPNNGNQDAWGVLVCYPLGQEYLRSYQAMQRLSVELARNGVATMRFDYSGTGDSAGDTGFADLPRYLEDIAGAATEFRESCDIRKLALVGLRMGATLACASRTVDVDRLILLDPVISGSDYLSQLEAMHEQLVLDMDRYHSQRKESAGSSSQELLGFNRSDNLAETLERLDLKEVGDLSCTDISILLSRRDQFAEDLANRWRSSGAQINCELIEADGNWKLLSSIEEPLNYWPIIRRLVELMR